MQVMENIVSNEDLVLGKLHLVAFGESVERLFFLSSCFVLSLQLFRGLQADSTHNMISIGPMLAACTVIANIWIYNVVNPSRFQFIETD